MRSFNIFQGDPIQIDYITIPGATAVKNFHRAFLAQYGMYIILLMLSW